VLLGCQEEGANRPAPTSVISIAQEPIEMTFVACSRRTPGRGRDEPLAGLVLDPLVEADALEVLEGLSVPLRARLDARFASPAAFLASRSLTACALAACALAA
jgi:hypothetical protein